MSAAEIYRWGITAILSQPVQFKSVVCSEFAVVAASILLYYSWVWITSPLVEMSLRGGCREYIASLIQPFRLIDQPSSVLLTKLRI